MPLTYDFDVLHLPDLPAEDAPEGAGRTADGVPFLALFRNPETAAALSGADPQVRDYFKSCGFGLGTHNSGASEGCIPEDTAQDVISVCMRVKQNFGQHDLKGKNWNGFDFKAFVKHIKSLKVEVVRTEIVEEPEVPATGISAPAPPAEEPSPLERVQLKYLNSVAPLGEIGTSESAQSTPDHGPASPEIQRPDPGISGIPQRPHPTATPTRKSSGVGVTTFLVIITCAVGAGGLALSNMRDTFFPEEQTPVSAAKPKVESDIVSGARRIRIDY